MRAVALAMVIALATAAPLAAQPTSAAGETVDAAARLACLRAAVTVADAVAVRRSVTFAITNDLDWALAGVRVAYRVQSESRSVPWEKGTAAVSIPGGVEPGETRSVSFAITPIPAEFSTADLQGEVELMDVADAAERLFIADVRVTGWSREPSPNACRPSG